MQNPVERNVAENGERMRFSVERQEKAHMIAATKRVCSGGYLKRKEAKRSPNELNR